MKSYVYIGALAVLPGLLFGGEVKVEGLMFGDYYHFTSAQDTANVQYQSGFWIRRIYLTFKADIADNFSSVINFEMNSPYGFDQSKSATLVPFVKDAYLKYKFYDQALLMGIIPAPTYSVVEKVWGKRYLEKTPEDLYRLAPTREIGVGLEGGFGILKYYLTFGNGEGERSEYNRNKKGMASLSIKPYSDFVIEIYGDWWDRDSSKDKILGHIFLGYDGKDLGFGVLYAQQRIQGGLGDPNRWDNIRVAGVFLRSKFMDNFGLVLRYDRSLDKNRDVLRQNYVYFPSDTSFHFGLVALEYYPAKNIIVSPNVEVIKSDQPNVKPTVISRLTLFYRF